LLKLHHPANFFREFGYHVEGNIKISEAFELGDDKRESAEFIIGDIEGDERSKPGEMPRKFLESVVLEEDDEKTLNVIKVGVI
jgi:hypothetical protein